MTESSELLLLLVVVVVVVVAVVTKVVVVVGRLRILIGTWKERAGISFEVLNQNLTAWLRKNTKTYNQDSQISGLDQTYAPPKYKFKALPLHQPARYVVIIIIIIIIIIIVVVVVVVVVVVIVVD